MLTEVKGLSAGVLLVSNRRAALPAACLQRCEGLLRVSPAHRRMDSLLQHFHALKVDSLEGPYALSLHLLGPSPLPYPCFLCGATSPFSAWSDVNPLSLFCMVPPPAGTMQYCLPSLLLFTMLLPMLCQFPPF